MQTQINTLGERIEKRFDAQEAHLSKIEERIRFLETKEAGCQPIITSRMDAAWRRLDGHEKEIAELTKLVNTQTNNITRMEDARKELDEDIKKRDEDFKTLVKTVNKQSQTISQLNNVAKWLLGILTAVLIALLIGLATGQLQIVVK